jgi:hypothetical protein
MSALLVLAFFGGCVLGIAAMVLFALFRPVTPADLECGVIDYALDGVAASGEPSERAQPAARPFRSPLSYQLQTHGSVNDSASAARAG